MTDFAIHTQDLSYNYGPVRAVDRVSLAVPAGVVFGFLGPNGAGKTTMIRLLLGLLEPASGSASVLGLDTRTNADDIRSQSGALLEYSGLYERLSAEENLELFGRIWRMSATDRRARVRELLTHVGLWERRKERVGTWSRGMKQKLVIGRTLFHRPRLVFLDEPTAGLDPVAAAALREDLAALAEHESVTLFLNTHNLDEAERMCAQVGVIREGQVLAVGSPDELRARQGTPRVEVMGRGFSDDLLSDLRGRPEVTKLERSNGRLTIDLNGPVDTAPLVTQIVASGAQVEEVRRGGASLEEVFLALMEEDK